MPLKARKIKRNIEKLFKRADGEWLQTTTAALGNGDGVVQSDTDGMIYARLRNGETIKVFNDVAPADFDVRVLIGKKKEQPTLWRVIAVRDAYATPQAPRVEYHHKQHELDGPDETTIDRKQIPQFTVKVKDGAAFVVMVYGGVFRTATGKAKVASQPRDLSSYVPATGAVYVDIEADSNGALSENEGAEFASPLIANVSFMPATTAGKYWICTILLFEGMEELLNKHIIVPFPLTTDYSLFETISLDDLLDVDAPTPADGDVLTWDAVAEEWIASDPAESSSGELVMEDGVTFPPVPVETEDGDDWVYSD